MTNLFDFLKAPRQVEELKDRIEALEAQVKAEAHFRSKTRHVLQQTEIPLQERLEKALQILASYDSIFETVVFGNTIVHASKPTMPNSKFIIVPSKTDKNYAIFYQSDYGDSKSTAV